MTMVRRTKTGHRKRALALTLCAIALISLLFALTGSALAEETAPIEGEATATAAEASVLDYTFTWPTFLLCLILVAGYYTFILRMSEKEFKGVVVERFGPKGKLREGS
jgi:hypothetical protein